MKKDIRPMPVKDIRPAPVKSLDRIITAEGIGVAIGTEGIGGA